MENNRIKYDLLGQFNVLLDKFPQVGIKYEYSEEYDSFIVSIDVSKLDDIALEEFSGMYGSVKRLLQNRYADYAPLFCLNEEWFSLSESAISYCNEVRREISDEYKWTCEGGMSFDLSGATNVVQESNLLLLAA